MKENSIEEDIERLKLCSNNQCHICGRYEKEKCMLERNRCEQHILSAYKRVLKENEELKETLKCTQNSWYEDTQKIEEMKKQIDLNNECEIALNNRIMDLENADKKWEDRIKAINERILELQELIEREK